MDERIEPTRNDPTPGARTGDSRFLPVVVIAAIALILILTAAILLIKGRGHKIVPHNQTERPISSLVMTVPAMLLQVQLFEYPLGNVPDHEHNRLPLERHIKIVHARVDCLHNARGNLVDIGELL